MCISFMGKGFTENPRAVKFLDRIIRKHFGTEKTVIYAMRYEAGVRGSLIFSRGVALAAGRTVEDIHLFGTSAPEGTARWQEMAVINRWRGKKYMAEALSRAHRTAVPMLDDRWIYNERGGNIRRVARDGLDSVLFGPSGIVLNFPAVAKRVG